MTTLLKPVAKLLFKVKYIGKENVPKEGSFILASNHAHIIDPGFIAIGKVGKLHFMSKQENFENRIVAWIFRHANSFPIKRGGADKTSLEYAIRLINEGKPIGIFPEGTRTKTGEPGTAKSGVALITKMTKADVVPVAVCLKDPKKVTKGVTVRFGKPIPFEDFGFSEENKASELKSASRLIMGEIVKLWEEGRCE